MTEVREDIDETDAFCIPISSSLEKHLPWLYGAPLSVFFWLRIHAFEREPRRGEVDASLRQIAAGIGKTEGMVRAGLAVLIEHGWLEQIACSDGWNGRTTYRIVGFKSMDSFRRLRRPRPCVASYAGPAQPVTHPAQPVTQGAEPVTQGAEPVTQGGDHPRNKDASTDASTNASKTRAAVAEVFDHFCRKTGARAHLEVWAPNIAARLKRFSVEQIKTAIDRTAAAPWWQEKPDLLRDPEQFFGSDKRIDKKLSGGTAVPSNGNGLAPKAKRDPCFCPGVKQPYYRLIAGVAVCPGCNGWVAPDRLHSRKPLPEDVHA